MVQSGMLNTQFSMLDPATGKIRTWSRPEYLIGDPVRTRGLETTIKEGGENWVQRQRGRFQEFAESEVFNRYSPKRLREFGDVLKGAQEYIRIGGALSKDSKLFKAADTLRDQITSERLDY